MARNPPPGRDHSAPHHSPGRVDSEVVQEEEEKVHGSMRGGSFSSLLSPMHVVHGPYTTFALGLACLTLVLLVIYLLNPSNSLRNQPLAIDLAHSKGAFRDQSSWPGDWKATFTPCDPQGFGGSVKPKNTKSLCALSNNFVTSRRQLVECNYPAVIVLPNVNFTYEHKMAWMEPDNAGPPAHLSNAPFPVVACRPKPDLPDELASFMESSLDDPPCVRPAVGREDVAYESFILQNYDNMPAHVFFMHGHETAWHQDRPTSELLQEFCGRPLPPNMYVSFGNQLSRDWRRIWCMPLFKCQSTHLQALLNRAWSQYFAALLGPMPPDLQHFCCSQMVVSRDRARFRSKQVWQAALNWSLQGVPGAYKAGPGRCSLDGGCHELGSIMEVLWPVLFGEAVPLVTDTKLGLKYRVESELPTDLLQAYRNAWST
mmetsp:Transcript_22462/g.49100  ORF Transcript_22462/g.49100 Transcript_22462/m.49100 type:complete len:428 (+) Transcript_22462:213-1496(+)